MSKKSITLLASLFLLVALLLGTSLEVRASSDSAPAAATAGTFTPAADAYVISTSPTTNFGSNVSLRVDGSPATVSYLRFVVTGLNGAAIQSAVLRIYANSANTTGFTVKVVANNTWVENQITYSNAPAAGSTIASSKAFTAGTWVQVDVGSYIKSEGTYSLELAPTNSTNTNLAARETGAKAPQLVVTTAGGTVATSTPTPVDTPSKTATPIPTGSASGNILLMAGDICKHNPGATDYTGNCKKTGDLIRSVLAANPGAQVQTLGDNVNNETGSNSYDSEYQDLYAPNWGSFMNVTHALEGNHDTLPPSGTSPYFDYFGTAAGPRPGGYYSYNIGSSWHVIVLNAQCSQAGGCNSGPQYTWLKNDLAANTKPCLLAVWHQPRWTSGRFPDNSNYAAWWSLLYQYKADIVANGHNHNYERFNQINPSEQASADGIREFVVGTGGATGDAYSYASHPLSPNEVIRNQTIVYGVLKLTLSASSYSWTFLPAAGYTFADSGTSACH